jgi:hypothetical protein
MKPPALARWLVRLACPARDLPYVLGDLDAEFQLRGGPVLWYWRQALLSAGALTIMGLRCSDWECALLAIFMASAAPILFMDAWWRFVLCHVPLKAGLTRGADFAVISLAYTAAVSFCAGALCTARGLRLAVPLAWVFILLGQAATHSIFPAWFSAISLVTVALSLAAGAWMRRILGAISLVTVALSLAAGAWMRRILDQPSPGRFV